MRRFLLAMLDGSDFANAVMPWGRPGPVSLPDDPDARARLVDAHATGGPADVLYAPMDRLPEPVRVQATELAAFCPDAHGAVRWLGFDLDGPDHGDGGLADPPHVARCFAEQCDVLGLLSGLIVARSRGGVGRHLFLIMPEPVPLADAVVGAGALAAAAFNVAARDAADGAPHAFRTAEGNLAQPGAAGAVELIPRSTQQPARGWSLALPTAARIVDPFTDKPADLHGMPRCDGTHWRRFIDDARATLAARRDRRRATSRAVVKRNEPREYVDPSKRLDERTRAFLDGRVEQGARNNAAFAATCNLIGCGVPVDDAERFVLSGAAACGLPDREARAAFKSAMRSMDR